MSTRWLGLSATTAGVEEGAAREYLEDNAHFYPQGDKRRGDIDGNAGASGNPGTGGNESWRDMKPADIADLAWSKAPKAEGA